MLRNGVIPIPPARKTAGRETFLCNAKDPIGPFIVTSAPIARRDNARLKAVSRMRVATTISSANGELAIEKV
jgi:hypothetical protein